ncbi:hypothetical protein OEA41_007958 [Lepraria neglecta]|uniref:Uncharacterized protein n=1 Tax=Lepraria neglecta TaxID=209136 RepID=A0AAD9ZGM4_9LECA|nr:hypothetical protein OEA41_007958 [Lepraria neglecta]
MVKKAADAKRKGLLQAIRQKERQEAGDAVPEAENYIDPNIVVTQCDYGARTARTGKKVESELDDGLGSPARNLDSCSVRGEDRIDNGQSSREPHQGSESRHDADHDCDGITYAVFIHHVRTKQQIFNAQLIAVTNMPFAEYVRQGRVKQQMTEAQPAAASDSPQQEKPLARTDPHGTVTTPKPKPHWTGSTVVPGTMVAGPSIPPRTIVFSGLTLNAKSPQANDHAAESSKAPATQYVPAFDEHLSPLRSPITPAGSEATFDQNSSSTPPVVVASVTWCTRSKNDKATRTVQSIKKSMGAKASRRQRAVRATFYPEEDGGDVNND